MLNGGNCPPRRSATQQRARVALVRLRQPASEGVAALEVYKSGRATVPSGGIGSTINIRTPRPFDMMGIRGSISARGVIDTSQNGKNDITPEVSGISPTPSPTTGSASSSPAPIKSATSA